MQTLIKVQSNHNFTETRDNLIEAIKKQGWHIFTQIKHSEEALNANLPLRPTELILFGNPRVGTLLMLNAQSVALDLPMRVLVMQEKSGAVVLCHHDIMALKEEHQIGDLKVLKSISDLVGEVCNTAAN